MGKDTGFVPCSNATVCQATGWVVEFSVCSNLVALLDRLKDVFSTEQKHKLNSLLGYSGRNISKVSKVLCLSS